MDPNQPNDQNEPSLSDVPELDSTRYGLGSADSGVASELDADAAAFQAIEALESESVIIEAVDTNAEGFGPNDQGVLVDSAPGVAQGVSQGAEEVLAPEPFADDPTPTTSLGDEAQSEVKAEASTGVAAEPASEALADSLAPPAGQSYAADPFTAEGQAGDTSPVVATPVTASTASVPKKSSKKLVILLLSILIVSAAGFATYYMLSMQGGRTNMPTVKEVESIELNTQLDVDENSTPIVDDEAGVDIDGKALDKKPSTDSGSGGLNVDGVVLPPEQNMTNQSADQNNTIDDSSDGTPQ